MDCSTDSPDTEDWPETYTQRVANLVLFQTLASTETSGDLVVLGECVILRDKLAQGGIGNWSQRLHASITIEDLPGEQKDATFWELFGDFLGSYGAEVVKCVLLYMLGWHFDNRCEGSWQQYSLFEISEVSNIWWYGRKTIKKTKDSR
jgi:hypothetical protein